MRIPHFSLILFSLLLTSIADAEQIPDPKTEQAALSIPFEKYQLENGLTVILHQDSSDPIVALATLMHVGSNREKPGRTGFAHFFEHMAFNDSENVPQGANRKMVEELGGTRNGGTWSDGTIYYEVVPKDAFEKIMWIDSDRLGFMINTVTEGALEREKQVVKNEKRQRVDNQAYGHTQRVIRKNLYPTGHPYNWTVIGDLEDLQAATLEDVREFYDRYYGPANATLVIAGDIDLQETRTMVERWFGEIQKSSTVPSPEITPVSLQAKKKLYHLDTFAKVPELRITFPTVEQYHRDSYALSALGEILSEGKRAVLYKEIVENQKIAPSVSAEQESNEITGTFTIRVRANADEDLDTVYQAVHKSLQAFEREGFSDKDLKRIKARQETQFYNGISSILDKAFQLGLYQVFAGDPGFITQDIENIKRVTRADVMRVYRQYVQGKNAIITSFVPRGQPDLIVEGSTLAVVVEEQVVAGAEVEFDSAKTAQFSRTNTKHDRSEPALGNPPKVIVPGFQKSQSANGMALYNIEHHELPLVTFSLRIDGGAWLEDPDRLGTANLLAQLMNEGTENRTPEQLEDAIGALGATVEFSSTISSILVEGNTLARNFDATTALVTEMLLQPRWDEREFDRIKARELNSIKQDEARPFSVARGAFYAQLYGDHHRAGQPTDGNSETVSRLTLADIKDFYHSNLTPQNASLHVVGDIDQAAIFKAIKTLSQEWNGKPVALPEFEHPTQITEPELYFVDIPDAKQSVIIVGKPALAGKNPDYYPFEVAQNRLGAGSSARLFQSLRIDKGYTYGAYTSLRKTHYQSPFLAYAQVRTNVTLESLQLFRELISNYDETFTQSDLATTKNLLTKRTARRFETLDNLLTMLKEVSAFQLPGNYVEQQQSALTAMTLKQAQEIYRKYADEQQMRYVVVGDAKTQLSRLKTFGYGDPLLLDRKGRRVSNSAAL